MGILAAANARAQSVYNFGIDSTGETTPPSMPNPFIDTEYNEESFFVRHAYFLGQNDPYGALKTTLKAQTVQPACVEHL
jgi:hypothetical protein